MKTIIHRLGIATLFSVLLISCGGNGGGDNGTDPDPVPDPSAATLIFPADNTVCNEGTIVSDTRSIVDFQWSASDNTDAYSVTVRNLESGGQFSRTSTTNSLEIEIDRGTPYEWFVTSRASGTSATAQSSSARFFNEGPGITNYAPFPATATFPARGANLEASTTEVTFSWEGSDLDDDIAEYELLLGTDPDNLNSQGTFTTASSGAIAVSSGTTYYWRIITRDAQGNSSVSDRFDFRVL
jgi:hypothetical protein